MKQKGDELIVMSKKMFFLILAGLSSFGILLGFSLGYITAPAKEVKIQKSEEPDRTVLPSSVDTAMAKKQESPPQEVEIKKEQTPQTQTEDKKDKDTEVQVMNKEETKQAQLKEPPREIEQVEKKEENLSPKKHRKTTKSPILSYYTIQIGAFSDISNAKFLIDKGEQAGYKVTLSKEDVYKVRIGKYSKFSHAKKVSEELKSKGFENFILKIKKTSKGGKT